MGCTRPSGHCAFSASSASGFRPKATTWVPAAASFFATANPIPADAPETDRNLFVQGIGHRWLLNSIYSVILQHSRWVEVNFGTA